MLGSIFGLGEAAGGFNNYLNAERTPVDFRGVFNREDSDALSIDNDRIGFHFHISMQLTKRRVVLQQMRQGRSVRQIIGGDEFDFRVMKAGPDDIPPDAAEAINPYFDCHILSS